MKKKLILSITIVSLMLLTGCESKTDKLENKINELESQINDISASTTTTTTTTESTTISSGTKSTKKKTTSTSTTTTQPKTGIKITISTTKHAKTTTRRIDMAFYDEEGSMPNGYKLCDSNNNCKCYLNNGTPKDC